MTSRPGGSRNGAATSRRVAATALLLSVALAGAPGFASAHGVSSDVRFRTGPPPSGRLPAVARISVLTGSRRAVLEGTVLRRTPAGSASPWWLLSVLPLLGLAGMAQVVVNRRQRA